VPLAHRQCVAQNGLNKAMHGECALIRSPLEQRKPQDLFTDLIELQRMGDHRSKDRAKMSRA